MSRKDELKASAESLGLSTAGTAAEIEARILVYEEAHAASAPPDADTEMVTAVYTGPGPRRFPGQGIVHPGDIVAIPAADLPSPLYQPTEET